MLYRNQYNLQKPKKIRGLFPKVEDVMQGYNPDDVTFPEPEPKEPTDFATTEPIKEAPVSSEEKPKKKNWLSRLFGTTEETPKVDEYGIEIPQKEKPNIGRRILEYAIPAIFGLTGGAGILPGIMAAMKQGKQRDINYVKMLGEYNKNRAAARNAKLNEEYKLGMLDIAKQRLARAGARGGGSSGVDRAMAIETKYRLDPSSVTPEEKAWLKAYYRLKQTQKAEPPETISFNLPDLSEGD